MEKNGAPAPHDTLRIRILNDQFRTTFRGGRFLMSAGIAALDPATQAALIKAVTTFTDFNPDCDPWGEHDFAVVEARGVKAFFKIDVYDRDLKFGSPDPADPAVSRRVGTLYLPGEH
jgi:hypothetical protein